MKMGLLLVLLFPLGPALAVGQESGAQASANEVHQGKKVCKRMTVIGTRLPSTVCHTQDEWDQIELATKSRMREIDSQRIQAHAEGD